MKMVVGWFLVAGVLGVVVAVVTHGGLFTPRFIEAKGFWLVARMEGVDPVHIVRCYTTRVKFADVLDAAVSEMREHGYEAEYEKDGIICFIRGRSTKGALIPGAKYVGDGALEDAPGYCSLWIADKDLYMSRVAENLGFSSP